MPVRALETSIGHHPHVNKNHELYLLRIWHLPEQGSSLTEYLYQSTSRKTCTYAFIGTNGPSCWNALINHNLSANGLLDACKNFVSFCSAFTNDFFKFFCCGAHCGLSIQGILSRRWCNLCWWFSHI